MEKKFRVWKNSTGMMFIEWTELHSSVIDPNEPDNVETFANIIGTTAKDIRSAIEVYEESEKRKIQAYNDMFARKG